MLLRFRSEPNQGLRVQISTHPRAHKLTAIYIPDKAAQVEVEEEEEARMGSILMRRPDPYRLQLLWLYAKTRTGCNGFFSNIPGIESRWNIPSGVMSNPSM